MHVVVIPSWYSNNENRVLGSFFKEQAIALSESGVNITIAYNEIIPLLKYKDFKIIFQNRITRSIEDGLDTYRYKDYNYYLHYHKRFLFFSKRLEKLISKIIFEKGKIDLLHFHSCFWAGVCASYLKTKFNIPYVITEHTSVYNSKFIKKSYMKYVKKAYDGSCALISVSRSLKNELSQISINKNLHVIHNFLDGNIFKQLGSNNSKVKSKVFKFFSLAFLVEGKGFIELIDACEKLFNLGYEFTLEIGGDGYLRSELEKQVINKGLSDVVKFLGLLDRNEVVNKMNECDSFIMVSKYETFGVVYIEALACGKPVIAVKNGGAEDIICDDNIGILIDECNNLQILNAMIHMIKTHKSYNSIKIREYFLTNFEKNNIIDKLKDVYKNCLSN